MWNVKMPLKRFRVSMNMHKPYIPTFLLLVVYAQKRFHKFTERYMFTAALETIQVPMSSTMNK